MAVQLKLLYLRIKNYLNHIVFLFGVVTLKRKFFDGKDHNDKGAIKDMEKFLSQQFSTLDWLKDQDVALVGVGGSARNVARIHQSEHTYPYKWCTQLYNVR